MSNRSIVVKAVHGVVEGAVAAAVTCTLSRDHGLERLPKSLRATIVTVMEAVEKYDDPEFRTKHGYSDDLAEHYDRLLDVAVRSAVETAVVVGDQREEQKRRFTEKMLELGYIKAKPGEDSK